MSDDKTIFNPRRPVGGPDISPAPDNAKTKALELAGLLVAPSIVASYSTVTITPPVHKIEALCLVLDLSMVKAEDGKFHQANWDGSNPATAFAPLVDFFAEETKLGFKLGKSRTFAGPALISDDFTVARGREIRKKLADFKVTAKVIDLIDQDAALEKIVEDELNKRNPQTR